MCKLFSKKRLISLLTLVVILIPMFTLAVYASSDVYDFGYAFNGFGGTQRFSGTKSDLGQSTAGAAGVTVTKAEFTAGKCTLSMEDTRQITISSARTISGKGNYQLYYKMDMLPDSGSKLVYLACYADQYVQAIAGRFQP